MPIWKQHISKRGFPKRNLHLLMLIVNDVPKNSISQSSWAPATFSHLFLFCTIFLLILRLPGRERGCQGIYACVHQLLPQSTYMDVLYSTTCMYIVQYMYLCFVALSAINGCGHSLCEEQLPLGSPSKTTKRIFSVKGGGTPPFRWAFLSTMIVR